MRMAQEYADSAIISITPMSLEIPITLEDDVLTPTYETSHAAGMDLRCSVDFSLLPMERMLVPTGLRMAIPHGFEGQVRPRSGLAMKYGIGMVNAPGTIDSDYRGEIGVLLINLGPDAVSFQKGERIAQLVVSPVIQATLRRSEVLSETERGVGGFGSTGKK
jgi:dUTP pyrophosphatase